ADSLLRLATRRLDAARDGRGPPTVSSPGSPSMRQGVRLGVDAGTVRIGVARSDPGGILASPLETVPSGKGDVDRIAALVAEYEAVEVIVGLPVSLSGQEGRA